MFSLYAYVKGIPLAVSFVCVCIKIENTNAKTGVTTNKYLYIPHLVLC